MNDSTQYIFHGSKLLIMLNMNRSLTTCVLALDIVIIELYFSNYVKLELDKNIISTCELPIYGNVNCVF